MGIESGTESNTFYIYSLSLGCRQEVSLTDLSAAKAVSASCYNMKEKEGKNALGIYNGASTLLRKTRESKGETS